MWEAERAHLAPLLQPHEIPKLSAGARGRQAESQLGRDQPAAGLAFQSQKTKDLEDGPAFHRDREEVLQAEDQERPEFQQDREAVQQATEKAPPY